MAKAGKQAASPEAQPTDRQHPGKSATQPSSPAPPATPKTLAEKIDHLFTVVHPAKGEYTHEQVASAIEAAGGPTISATYLWQLRKGLRDNPTKRHLEALSSFFGVPVSYFFDEDVTATVDADLALLTALRDPLVRELAITVSGLSATTLRPILDLAQRARELENLDPA